MPDIRVSDIASMTRGGRMSSLRAKDLADRTGLTPRFFQKLAKRIDWATQPEQGGPILFDEDGFNAWLAAGRPKVHKWRKSIGETVGRGRVRRSRVWNAETPLAHVLKEKLKSVSKGG